MAQTLPSSPSSQPSTPKKAASGGRLFMILLTVFEVGASIVIVWWVTSHGGSDFSAYMWSLLPPVVGAGIYWAKTRSWSWMSTALLAFNLLSAGLAAIGSHDSKVLLYKDCFATALIGLIFLVSLFFRRPLVFWFGQRFATDGSPQGLAWWDSLWQFKQFRDSQRQTTLLWVIVMWLEAASKAWMIKTSSFKTAYVWDQILPLIATGVGIAGTMWLAARAAAAGKKARAERLASEGRR